MKIYLAGKVKNTFLPKTKPLLPLFETVINSFQALDEAPETPNAYIRIRAMREASLPEGPSGAITGFTVEDNGIGFNEPNFESFITSDSPYKWSKGGKGLGRFLWLKAFDKAEIESHFVGLEGKRLTRSFTFSVSADSPPDEVRSSSEQHSRTIVRLFGLRMPYYRECPKHLDIIAERLVEHCLPLFLNPGCPDVTLEDENECLNLNVIFHEQFGNTSYTRSFSVDGQTFTVRGFRLRRVADRLHKLLYAAHYREVVTERLDRYLLNLRGRQEDERGAFHYLAFIEGQYLDDNVNGERTQFLFPDGDDATDNGPLDQKALLSQITLRQIREQTIAAITEDLRPLLQRVDDDKKHAFEQFVSNEAPWYHFLIKDFDSISPKVPPDRLSHSSLDLVLHQEVFERQRRIKQETATLLASSPDQQSGEYRERFKGLIERINELGKSSLAQYIVHRKVILEFLEKSLERDPETGAARLEETVHNLIFPMQATSDDIPYERQNLWIMDERLSYHSYLASDQALNRQETLENDSLSRPDLLIFDRPLVFVEGDQPLTSITLVEFKRPQRTNYPDEDPVDQVIRLIREIKEGRFKTKGNRTVSVASAQIPAYAYVVCDLTPKLRGVLEKEKDMTRTPDNMGFFDFKRNLNTYIEVIEYNKLLRDAKLRNRILFEKLHLSFWNA